MHRSGGRTNRQFSDGVGLLKLSPTISHPATPADDQASAAVPDLAGAISFAWRCSVLLYITICATCLWIAGLAEICAEAAMHYTCRYRPYSAPPVDAHQ